MDGKSYWQKQLPGRASRRTVLAAAAMGAFLAACKGDDDSAGGNSEKSGLIAEAADTSKQAKRGGVVKTHVSQDITGWDPYVPSTTLVAFASLVYMRPAILRPGYLKASSGEIDGDFAESYEFSPDRLQLSLKLRQNAAFHPVPPVNGRLVDVQDALYSWERFSKVSNARSQLANSVNPKAPIISITAPDQRTLAIKLAYPIVSLPALLAAPNQASFAILPRESEGQYDLRRTVIGSGPFYLSEYSPSTRLQFKRNPGYYIKDKPYVDGLDYPIIPEYATALAALRAGHLYTYPVRQIDVVPLKRDVPQISMYQTDLIANASGAFFGYKPTDRSPFRDERVRQAFSMSLDRDAYIDVIFEVSAYNKQGLPIQTRWHSSFAANEFEGWWLDPKGKEFGPNAVHYQLNRAEAKKLLAAAGHPSGVDVISNNASSGYGPDYPRHIEIVEEMATQVGFRFTKNIVDYNTAWQPNFRDAQGNFEGIAYKPFLAPSTDPLERMAGQYFSAAGSTFFGFDPEGKGTFSGDPFIDDLVIKNRMELDVEKRRAAVLEMQRYLAKRQYAVRYPGTASGFNVAWPVLKNWNVFRGDPRDYFYEWLDATSKPLADN